MDQSINLTVSDEIVNSVNVHLCLNNHVANQVESQLMREIEIPEGMKKCSK